MPPRSHLWLLQQRHVCAHCVRHEPLTFISLTLNHGSARCIRVSRTDHVCALKHLYTIEIIPDSYLFEPCFFVTITFTSLSQHSTLNHSNTQSQFSHPQNPIYKNTNVLHSLLLFVEHHFPLRIKRCVVHLLKYRHVVV